MNPHDLTGRDLDLAVAKRLGYVWWAATNQEDRADYGVSYLRPHETPPHGWHRIDEPGPEWDSPWLPGYDCDGGRIPELFAEIAKAVPPTSNVTLWRSHNGQFCATARGAGSTGSTPNEALARLLLLVL